MDKMYFNKVEIKNPKTNKYETVFDIQDTDIQPNDVRAGKTFYNSLGIKQEGRIALFPEEENLLTNDFPIRFYNYCGQLMYAYTYDEFEALTELPEGRDEAKYGLYFQEWNYTLDEIKLTKSFVDVGAIYSTTPNLDDPPVTKVYVDTTSASPEVQLYFAIYDGFLEVDWGDGEISILDYYFITEDGTHSYEIPGEYTIKINTANSSYYTLGFGSTSQPLACGEAVKGVAIGNDRTKYGIDAESGDLLFADGSSNISFVAFPVTCAWIDHIGIGWNIETLHYMALPQGIEIVGQPFYLLSGANNSYPHNDFISVPYNIKQEENKWATGEEGVYIDLSSNFKHITLIPTDSDSQVAVHLSWYDTSLEINKKKIDLTRLKYQPTLEISSSIIKKLENLTKDNIIFYVPAYDVEGNKLDWENETNWSSIKKLIEEV